MYVPLSKSDLASDYDGWRNVHGMPRGYSDTQLDRAMRAQAQANTSYAILECGTEVYRTGCKLEATSLAAKLRKMHPRHAVKVKRV